MEESLYAQLNHCINLIQRMESAENPGIPQGQSRILLILDQHGTLTQKELTECLQIRSASLSELLTKLETKGLIKRTPGKQDKRVQEISLTRTGLKEAEHLGKSGVNLGARIYDALTDKEKKDFSRILEKIITSLEPEEEAVPVKDFCIKCGLCAYGYKKILKEGK